MNIDKIREHYEHAKQKHPYFCDKLTFVPADMAARRLESARDILELDIAREKVPFRNVLNCEIWEILESLANGNNAAAVEECYDAIAVLLRVVDVLEGRQALGDPAKKEGAK